jgi:hypothetical protein
LAGGVFFCLKGFAMCGQQCTCSSGRKKKATWDRQKKALKPSFYIWFEFVADNLETIVLGAQAAARGAHGTCTWRRTAHTTRHKPPQAKAKWADE